MATAPSLVSESESSFVVNTTPKTQALTVTLGDRITVLGMAANNLTTISTPSDGVNTYMLQNSIVITDFCTAYIWTATAASSATLNIQCTRGGAGGDHWGINAFNDNGSDGFGATAKTNTTGAPSLSITTLADNSAIYVIVGDWNALATARTWRTVNSITPTSGNGHEKTYVQDGANYTIYIARYPDAGTAGAKTVGLSAPTGEKYSIIAMEVKGAAGGTDLNVSDTPSGFRLGESPVLGVTFDSTATDQPGGYRLGSSDATTTYAVTAGDTPTGVRLGLSNTVAATYSVLDTPSWIRLGQSPGTAAADHVASDTPTGFRVGASPTVTSQGIADTPSGIRLGQSGGSVASDVAVADTQPGWFRLGDTSAISAGAVTIASDSPSGFRVGESPVAGVTFGVTASDTLSGYRLGFSAADASFGVMFADTPLGVRLGLSPATTTSNLTATDAPTGFRLSSSGAGITSGLQVTDTPNGYRFGATPPPSTTSSGQATDTPLGYRLGYSPVSAAPSAPVDVAVSDLRPHGFRLGSSPATVFVGVPTPPGIDVVGYVRVPVVGSEIETTRVTSRVGTRLVVEIESADVVGSVKVVKVWGSPEPESESLL